MGPGQFAHIEERAGGAANVLAAHVHLDETTPHIQATTIPLVQKAVGRRGRRPKGSLPLPPAEPSWRLSARDLVGGSRETLVAIQDDYAEAMAGHGLRRGIPRKETGARNRPLPSTAPSWPRWGQSRSSCGLAR